MLGSGIQGRTLGIVGMGGIGEALAIAGAGVRHDGRSTTTGARSTPDDRGPSGGARRVELDELLATSDVVSINCPYSADTHHLVDAAALGAHAADRVPGQHGPGPDRRRGRAGRRAPRPARSPAPALDVFEHEPDVHPGLLELDNVVLVPHLGSATVETRDAMATLAARNVIEVLAGRRPVSPVS